MAKFANIFKDAAATSAGMIFGVGPQLVIAITIFILGLILKNQADADDVQDYRYYTGIAMMIIGAAFGFGMNSEILLSEVLE